MSSHLQKVRNCQQMVKDELLIAPASFREAHELAISSTVNGCGATGAKFDFVPDTIYGLHIFPACFIHDWCYAIGKTDRDKREADNMFLMNMFALIENEKGIVNACLRPFRRRRAVIYYEAVTEFGGKAYWAGKERKNDI